MDNRQQLKDIAFQNLVDFKEVMEECGFHWWLDSGIALGLHRNKEIIDGDEDDTDVCLWKEDEMKSFEFLPKLEARGFTILHDWRFPYVQTMEPSSEGIGIKRNGNKIDIIAMRRKKNEFGDTAYYLARNLSGQEGRLPYFAFCFPGQLFDEFGTVEYRGVKFPVPKDIEGYLVARYGPGWQTPISRLDGSWSGGDKINNPCHRSDWGFDDPEAHL